MKPFDYQRAERLEHAAQLLAVQDATAIAGGTNLIDLMKLQVEKPQTLVDVNHLPLGHIADERGWAADRGACQQHRYCRPY